MKSLGYFSVSLVAAFPYLFNMLPAANELPIPPRGGTGLDKVPRVAGDTPAGTRQQDFVAQSTTQETSGNRPLPGDVCLFSSFNGNEIQARECGSGYFSAQGPEHVLGTDERQHPLRSTVQVERGRSESGFVSEGRLA